MGGGYDSGRKEEDLCNLPRLTKYERNAKPQYPTLQPLRHLLELCHNGDMALPDFQRSFIWDPRSTDELIESITCNYPAGTLLRIENGEQLLFRPRAIQGAPDLNGRRPAYLILDGQQRLTSLYQAFYGVGEHRFYLNLSELEKGKPLDDCAFYMRVKDGDKLYGNTEQQAKSLVFPLSLLFSTIGGFDAWQNQVLRALGGDALAVLDLHERLTKLHNQWIKPIEGYEFPMVTLDAKTSGRAVCTIFETLNRTGVKLSVYDLLTARFWPDDVNLRTMWQEAQTSQSTVILKDFDLDPYYILQVIALLEPGLDDEGKPRAPSVRRSAILDMKVDQARRGWGRAISALAEALSILRDECGVLVPSLLPYNTILIPMAAAWAAQEGTQGPAAGTNRIKIKRWFWCSVFGQTYENAPNSQAEKDFAELRAWMAGGAEPESVKGFQFKASLREVTPRQRAVYRGAMALILQHGALDFFDRGPITTQLIGDFANPVDDHHVFPQAFLNKQGADKTLRDCILNRTYIGRGTDASVGKRAPSDYFKEMRATHGAREADTLLESHLLPTGDPSPLLTDDFATFLDNRERALLARIAQCTGS